MQEVTVRRERGYPWAASNPKIGSALSREKTSNVQHRTPNAEVSEDSRCHSMFGVGCSMFVRVHGEGGRRSGEGVVHGPNACAKAKGSPHLVAADVRRLTFQMRSAEHAIRLEPPHVGC